MSTSTIVLESFTNPSHVWESMNDPVMGGRSSSSVSIDGGVGIFEGEVAMIPFLHAPGFITMRTKDGVFPDVSSCDSLRLRLRASEPYAGYRVSFGNRRVEGNGHARGYKANFDAPVGSEMGTVDIPFEDFTVRWSDYTGDPIVTCRENEDFCPDLDTLRSMETISLWGEGVEGRVRLRIESIAATGCSPLGGAVGFPPILGAIRVAHTAEGVETEKQQSTLLLPMLLVVVATAAFAASFVRRNRMTKTQQIHVEEMETPDENTPLANNKSERIRNPC